MTAPSIRRVVTGIGDDGRSTVAIDAAATAVVELPAVPGTALVDLWRSDAVPLDPHAPGDPPEAPFALMPTGSLFRIIDLAPTAGAEPMWHETASVDFVYVASGSCSLLLEDGRVELHAGGRVVVRGGSHAWVNDGDEPWRLVDVSIATTDAGGAA
jgi:quercetin dioxygenase-like cupin family protein